MIHNSKKNIQNFISGFSLLELLIYIAILSIIMVISSNMFVSLSKSNGRTNAKVEVDAAIRFASEMIRQDLKNASSVSIPSLGTPSSTLVLVRNGNTITYNISSGILQRKEGVNSPVDVTSSNIVVAAPVFTRIENNNIDFSSTSTTIKINMTFSYNSTSSDWNYSNSLQTSVSLYK